MTARPMGAAMNLEDYLKLVGTELGVSEWHTIDQKQIDAFADATEDLLPGPGGFLGQRKTHVPQSDDDGVHGHDG